MNGGPGCEQLRKRDRERSVATAEIAPGLGSVPFDPMRSVASLVFISSR